MQKKIVSVLVEERLYQKLKEEAKALECDLSHLIRSKLKPPAPILKMKDTLEKINNSMQIVLDDMQYPPACYGTSLYNPTSDACRECKWREECEHRNYIKNKKK